MRWIALLLLSLVMPACAGAQKTEDSRPWTPDAATIGKLEVSIKRGDIPQWAHGHVPVVTDYDRYYAGGSKNGESVVLGEFIAADISFAGAGIHVVRDKKDLPIIFDGGCGVVNIVYSVKLGRVTSLVCNGRA
jgi:hypothetical protein